MLLLLERCRIAQIGIEIHPGKVQSHSSHWIIYADLSWKDKLLPKWKVFPFFSSASFLSNEYFPRLNQNFAS